MLDKKLIPIAFLGDNGPVGVDSIMDEYLQTSPRELNNIVFNVGGRATKRYGYTALANKDISNTVINDGELLTTFKDELCLFNSNGLYSYYDSLDKWDHVSNRTPTVVETKPLLRNVYTQKNPMFSSLDNVSVVVWEDSRGGVRASVYGETSGHSYQDDVVIDATGMNPKLVQFRGYIYLFWVTVANELKAKRLNTGSPTAFEAELTFVTDINTTNPFYDITFRTQTWFIIAYNNGAATITLGYYNPETGDAATPDPNKLPDPIQIGGTAQTFLKVDFNTTHTTKTIFVTYNNATNIVVEAYQTNFVQIYTPQTLASPTTADTVSCAHYTSGNSTTLYYHISATLSYDHLIYTLVFDNTDGSVTSAASVLVRSVGLLSEPIVYNDKIHLLVSYDSIYQATNYLYNATDGLIVAKIGSIISGGHNDNTDRLTDLFETEGDVFKFATRIKTRTSRDEGVFFSTIGVYRASIDLSTPRQYQAIEAGELLFTTGSIPLIYDGRTLSEAGFLVYPEDPAIALAGSGGSLGAGVYQWVCVYKWTDNQGQTHRSAPSLAVTKTAVSSDKATLTIPTYRIGDRTDVIIEVYRTEVDGSVFYLVSEQANSASTDSITYVDGNADSGLIDNEILYTSGGVLQNAQPAGCSCTEFHQGRVFIGGLTSTTNIWYSKQVADGFGVEFSDLQIIDTGDIGGAITALKTLGDNLLIFKESSIGILTGKGANTLGQGATYEYDVLTTDMGVTDPGSIVKVGQDVFFKSTKGFYKLMPNFLMTYIGGGVRRYKDVSISSAISVVNDDLVIFGTMGGQALCYNPLFQIWTTFSNYGMIDSVYRGGSFYFVNSDGVVKKSSTNYSDDGSPIISTILTNWVKTAGVQGFQRIYKIQLLGERIGNHSAKMEILHNFRDDETETFTFNDSRSDIYGTSALNFYGDTPYGGEYEDYFHECKPRKQKCTSVAIKIEDYYTDGQPSGGFDLTAIVLEVGVKQGRYKGEKRQRATTTTES